MVETRQRAIDKLDWSVRATIFPSAQIALPIYGLSAERMEMPIFVSPQQKNEWDEVTCARAKLVGYDHKKGSGVGVVFSIVGKRELDHGVHDVCTHDERTCFRNRTGWLLEIDEDCGCHARTQESHF